MRLGELSRYESLKEASIWLQHGIEAAGDQFPERAAALYLTMGGVRTDTGDYAGALVDIEKGMNLLPAKPGRFHIDALTFLGTIYSYQGDIQKGMSFTRQALELSQKLRMHFRTASLMSNLSLDQFFSGNWMDGIVTGREALSLAERLGSQQQRVRLILNTGWMHILTGDDAIAERLLKSSLALSQEHNLRDFELLSQANLADLYIRQGKYEAAKTSIQTAEKLVEAMQKRA